MSDIQTRILWVEDERGLVDSLIDRLEEINENYDTQI